MALKFEVTYHEKVVHDDIPNLSAVWEKKIKEAIEEKLTTRPDVFGKSLRRSLKGYRKLRVGDYRVVFRIGGTTVFVLTIRHRSTVYHEAEKRMELH